MDNRIGDMQTFLAVTEGGSFASAARALRLTPSAVSRSIARIEARLGVLLIQRTTRSLSLTPEGESYRSRISALLAEVDAVERSLHQLARRQLAVADAAGELVDGTEQQVGGLGLGHARSLDPARGRRLTT